MLGVGDYLRNVFVLVLGASVYGRKQNLAVCVGGVEGAGGGCAPPYLCVVVVDRSNLLLLCLRFRNMFDDSKQTSAPRIPIKP